jgi:hypothetical protein
VIVNFPRFTTEPPQLHHQKTKLKTGIFAKTPAKTPTPPQK